MSKRANPAVLGAFIIGGLAILVAALLVIGGGKLFRHTERFVLYFREGVGGLKESAPVMFKGIEVGAVKDVRINLSRLVLSPEDVRIPVVIEIDRDRLRAEGADIDPADPRTLDRLIAAGLRGSLETQSLVTGQRYISLDFAPDTPVVLLRDPAVPYPEIPVRPTKGEEIQQDLASAVAKLSRTDFEGTNQALRKLIDTGQALLAKPELARAIERLDRVSADLDSTLVRVRDLSMAYGPRGAVGHELMTAARSLEDLAAQAAATIASAGRLIAFDGPLLDTVQTTLGEVHDAARSLSRLADQLGRDPGSIVRGGPP